MSNNLDGELDKSKTESEASQKAEVGWLQNLVTSLQQALSCQEREQQRLTQELRAMNEAVSVLYEKASNADQTLSLLSAKELAKRLVAEDIPTREALATMLTAIYRKTVSLEELDGEETNEMFD